MRSSHVAHVVSGGRPPETAGADNAMTPATDFRRRALCIGIDAYPNLAPAEQLGGCVNDAMLAAAVLRDRFGFPEDGVRLLLDGEASRAGILAALDRLVQETGTDDVVVVHYSGHGSWAWDEDGDEADGKDETIMPSDSGRGDHPNLDIVDDEIHGVLLALTERTPHVTFVFDSCHSGSITRDASDQRARSVAGAGPDDPQPPPAGPAVRGRVRGAKSIPGPSGFMNGLGARYVLVAGCHDEERSYEHVTEAGVAHGALSYHLYGYLATASGTATWRDVFEHVSMAVTGANDRQRPQLEGASDRLVFGTGATTAGRYLLVTARDGSEVTLAGGAAHGVRVGSTWSVLPAGGRDEQPAAGTIEVTDVAVTESRGRIVEEATDAEPIGPACRARVKAHVWGDFRLPVHVLQDDSEADDDVVAMTRRIEASPLLRSVDDPSRAGLRVHPLGPGQLLAVGEPEAAGASSPEVAEAAWVVTAATGAVEVPPVARGEGDALVRNLERVARYRQALALANPSATSRLAGSVRVELLRPPAAPAEAAADPTRFEPAEAEVAGGSVVLHEGDRIGFRVHNDSGDDLYLNVLDFGLTGRVARVFPDNTQGVLVAPGTYTIPGYLDLYIPDEYPFAGDRFGSRRDEGMEVYKFVFTPGPADLSFLTQDSFEKGEPPVARGRSPSPLEFLARAATYGTRDGAFVSTDVDEEDWTVVDKPLILRRRRSWPLADGQAVSLGVTSIASEGVTGSVEMHGWEDRRAVARQGAAALDEALAGAGMRTAATFEFDGIAVPAASRSAAPTLTIDVEAPPPDHGQVLLSADEAGVLRFHFGRPVDGDAGEAAGPRTRSGGAPARMRYTLPGAPAPPLDAPRARGLTGALGRKFVKVLVFYAGEEVVKASGQTLATIWERNRVPTRLRTVGPEDYRHPHVPDLGEGDSAVWSKLSDGRGLLLVHGTFSRSDRAFGGLAPEAFGALHDRYEGRVIAFDHATLSCTPSENVDAFLERLPSDVNLEVDILAHSRGGLVARRLAAVRDPRLRVRRVVFAGAPNAGTAMASPKHINRLLDVYANLLTFFPDNGVTDAMEGLLAVVQDVALGMMGGLRGLQSMVPGNDGDQRVEGDAFTTRYFGLASDYEPTDPGLKAFMDPLADQVFVGAGNDLVVPTDSVWRGLGVSPFPLARSSVRLFGPEEGVGHSDYFRNDASVSTIVAWLTEE